MVWPVRPIKRRVKKARRALEEAWLSRRDPLELARRQHREARHAKNRKGLVRYIPPGGVGVEVGVFWAHFSEVLVADFKPSKLYLVDPWDRLHGETFNFKTPYTLNGDLPVSRAMAAAEALAARHPEVVELRKAFSTEFFPNLPDGSLDWVYLDASHKYEHVRDDLACIWPKLKPTGVLFGDDYFEDPESLHAGTRRAVDEFCAAHDVPLIKERHYQYVMPRAEAPMPPPDPDQAALAPASVRS